MIFHKTFLLSITLGIPIYHWKGVNLTSSIIYCLSQRNQFILKNTKKCYFCMSTSATKRSNKIKYSTKNPSKLNTQKLNCFWIMTEMKMFLRIVMMQLNFSFFASCFSRSFLSCCGNTMMMFLVALWCRNFAWQTMGNVQRIERHILSFSSTIYIREQE